jgi:primosomal protein N' (replication factor Y)
MEQVSGRAGRKEATGKVLVQTSNPSHPVLQFVQQHNYKGMFEEELVKRKQFAYPPYTRMILLTFKHKIRESVENAAHQFAAALKNKYGNYIVGPAEPVINRVRNQYLMEMLLKLPRDAKLIAQCKKDVLDQIAILHNEKRFRSVVIVPDVDVV